MKPKINLEKFICSYIKWNNIQDALKDQGLKCWRGEIVEIENEDEDDRIKKEILDLVSISGNGNQFEEIKDWLEKQVEQKSKWSEEDEELCQDTLDVFEALGNGLDPLEDYHKLYDWMRTIKQRLEEQQ